MGRIAICCSGGLDSTYLLWRTALDHSHQIRAIYLKSDDVCTNKRVLALFNLFMERERPIEIDVVSQAQLDDIPWPINISRGRQQPAVHLVKYGATLAANGAIDELMTGHEIENDGIHRTPVPGEVIKAGTMFMQEVFAAISDKGKLTHPLQDIGYSQATAMALLPPVFLEMTFSCLNGAFGQPCGHCVKCVKRRFIAQRLVKEDHEAVTRFILSQSTVIDQQWWSLKHWVWRYSLEFERKVTHPKNSFPIYPTGAEKRLKR